MSERQLTVYCRGGLANRLRVLLSSLALAEASGRAFTMLWPLNNTCGAPFTSLFANPWNVRDLSHEESLALPVCRVLTGLRVPNLLEDQSPHLLIQHVTWLVSSHLYPAHRGMERRCIELLEELEPNPMIRDEVARFRAAHFRPTMIGVHVRRGDFLRARPDVSANTNVAIDHVRKYLALSPDAGILLCTDDGAEAPGRPQRHEGVARIFRDTFGDRVVSREPRSLDRRTPEAVQDALIDLLLLRHTQMVVGTAHSSFSTLAAHGRNVPFVRAGAPQPSYLWKERVAKATGLYYLVKLIGWYVYGRSTNFVVVWRSLVSGRIFRLRRRWRPRRTGSS